MDTPHPFSRSFRNGTLLALALLSVAVLGGVGLHGASAVGAQDMNKTFYRLYNPTTGDHFYTADWLEALDVIKVGQYHWECGAARIAGKSVPGLVPFFRLYNPKTGDHFYTTDWNEALHAAQQVGYKYEGKAGYISSAPGPGLEKLYRLYNSVTGDHFYTTDWDEAMEAWLNDGYKQEGVAGYVMSVNFIDSRCDSSGYFYPNPQ